MPLLFETDDTQVTPGGIEEGIKAGRNGLNEGAAETVRSNPNPDKAAKIRRLSKETNVPQDVVQQNPSVFEAEQRVEAMQAQTADYPVTQQYLNDPNFLPVVTDDTESLTSIEQLSRTWRAGRKTVELGELGTELRSRPDDIILRAEIDRIQQELSALGVGVDEEGFISWASSASEVLGQMYETLATPESAAAVGAGTGVGAAAGAAGFSLGPLGFLTVPGGAVTGASTAAAGYFAWKSYVTEGGLAYLDLLKEGIEPELAGTLSHGVGVLNAALEVGGAIPVVKPLSVAAKTVLKRAVSEAVQEAGKKILVQGARAYGTAIVAEVTTEVLQETVNIAAEEIGKEFTSEELEGATVEEVKERLTGIATKTMKAMVFLAAPGAGAQITAQYGAAKRAKQNANTLRQIKETADNSKLAGRDAEALGDFLGDSLKSNGVDSVLIPGDKFAEWLQEAEGGNVLVENLGIADDIQNALETGQDVEIGGAAFGKHVVTNPNFDKLVKDIRAGQFEMTEAEATEFAETGLADQVEGLDDRSGDPAVDIAEAQMGMKAFFSSAEEAGMTPAKYEAYLEQRAAARDETVQRQETKRLREELRELEPQFQEQLATERVVAGETLRNEPVYQAITNLQADRLDRAAMEEAVAELGITLDDLPQYNGRKIYAAKGETTSVDPQLHAELHGYSSTLDMVLEMATATPFEQAVEEQAKTAMRERYGTLTDRIQDIEAALDSMHHDANRSLLMTELNAMRTAQKQKQLSQKLVKAAVRKHIGNTKVSRVTSSRFLGAESRAAKEASKALKQGDLTTAQRKKFQQVLNFEAAKQATRLTKQVTKQRKFMSQFLTGKWQDMPVENLQAIRELLSEVNFGSRISEDRLIRAKQLANTAKTADPVKLWHKLQEQSQLPNWQDLTMDDFQSLHDKVKEIRHKGVEANKLRLETEREQLDGIAGVIAGEIRELKPTSAAYKTANSLFERVKQAGRGIQTMVFTMDTITRLIDGFQDLGPAYQNTKGRLDRALSRGYRPGQVGYLRRSRAVSQELTKIYSTWTKKERNAMRKPLRVPGVNKEMTHERVLSVLLNSGNEGNLTALTESGTFTQEEIDAIHQYASKKDWDFAQKVWDYIDTFWEEIAETEKRRSNHQVKRVEPKEIETQHGKYKGGYFPIRYDNPMPLKTLLEDANLDKLQQEARYGGYASSHTARGHTEARVNPGQSKVLLDLFVINSHMERVIYDLEVGDALTDVYKVWFHPEVKNAFVEQGYQHLWEAGQLWLQDSISGELVGSDVVQHYARHLRTGFTVAKLGMNFAVALQQPLGLIQSSVHIGHGHMIRGMYAFMRSKWVGDASIFKWIEDQSGFMEARSDTFDKDVLDSRTQFATGLLGKILPRDMAEVARSSLFLPIRKTQKLTDAITWLSGYDKGMKEFGDHQKAVDVADRAVSRSQASGIFSERSNIERGTTSSNIRQNELARVWTTLLSYFIAKTNVAYERFKTTKFRNPVAVMGMAADMVVLYVVETILAELISGRGPEEGAEPEDVALWVLGESVSTGAAGIPFLREGVTAAKGFAPGGTIGSFSTDVGRSFKQVTQGEIDAALVKNLNSVGGMIFHYPSSQINKFVSAEDARRASEDITFMNYILGYREE